MKGKELVFKVIIPAVCCIICAIVIWNYVMTVTNPEREETVKAGGITVNAPEGYVATVTEGSAVIRGPHTLVVGVLTHGLPATVTYEEGAGAGTYTFPASQIVFSVDQITVECESLTVTLASDLSAE